ncbi:centrosomal protein CCDC61-like [Pongo abelii]|uniref:centrosomal protein CCDC61-like n=1 Tax=Pongo abelii TaxID=9601 RepID=UPI003006EF8F
MGSPEQGLGRGLALAAGADWRAADLPAALQGGARRAIFRGLYKGAEAAARRPRSGSARDGQGRGDTRASSRDAGSAGRGLVAGLRPSTAGARAPQREGVARRRGGPEAGGREVKVWSEGSGRLLEGPRRRGPRGSRRGRGAGRKDTGHPASAWARGRDPREAVPGRSSRTQKQAEKASRAPSRTPHRLPGCREEAPEEEVPHNGREQRRAERDRGLRPPPACAQSPPRPAGPAAAAAAAAAAALPLLLLTPSERPGRESGG